MQFYNYVRVGVTRANQAIQEPELWCGRGDDSSFPSARASVSAERPTTSADFFTRCVRRSLNRIEAELLSQQNEALHGSTQKASLTSGGTAGPSDLAGALHVELCHP